MRDSQQSRHELDPQADERWRLLTEQARIEGRQVWLGLLQDRLLWNEAPAWAQDECIRAASEKLGASFQFLDSKLYECGGQRHRIASFRILGADPNESPLLQESPLDWVFRLIPGGTFTMGSPERRDDPHYDDMALRDEQPTRGLYVPPLLVAATLTTQAMWTAFDPENPSSHKGEDLPVEDMSWEQAREWIERLGPGFRFPSEAEWEYFCRGGTPSRFCYGDDPDFLSHYAWFYENSDAKTHPVAGKKANAFGLFDVHGNVWEWCQDRSHYGYKDAPKSHLPWDDSDSSIHVIRGGGYFNDAQGCRSAYRGGYSRGYRGFGFRLVRGLDL